jgi:hypothetical protein
VISPEAREVVFTYTSGPVFQLMGADQPRETAQAGEAASPPAVAPLSDWEAHKVFDRGAEGRVAALRIDGVSEHGVKVVMPSASNLRSSRCFHHSSNTPN